MLSLEIDNFIKNKLLEIVNYNNEEWNKLEISLKTKIIHNYCNKFLKQNLKCELKIPLKSIKPKKIIQLCGFSKQQNKEIYNLYLENSLKYTFLFREKYKNCKDRQFYNYNHLSMKDRDIILYDLNKIVYDTINKNILLIKSKSLFNNLLIGNMDKICLIDNNYNLKIEINNKELKLIFNENIIINLNLILTGDKITNNIPVKYNISLLNNIIKNV